MVTTAFCVFGYWRTCRAVSARSPSTRINALTTIASTGFFMKMSVKFIACALWPLHPPLPASLLLRGRIRVVCRFHAVVDTHRRAILQFDLAAGDDLDPRVESGEDRDLIAAGRTGGHEGLLHHQRVRRWLRGPLIRGLFIRRLLGGRRVIHRIGVLGRCSGLIGVELVLLPDHVD